LQAIKAGYKVTISCGYAFNRDYIFNDLKRNADNNVNRTIAKLFINSLYGRMGMSSLRPILLSL